MIYLKRLCLPSDDEEFAFFLHEKRTCRWTELENVRAYFDFFQTHREEFESLM
ncbi:MAG: hypothetical protein PUB43_04945 [Oscillospiraceae bacterium]|nr:hypothetical protein [Oscillospiraceae bacterium]